ncbi:MAG: Gfo/Idh/MocA family protein [Bacteroidota bacterium]
MSADCKVAVVGCGYWGPKLVRNFTSILHKNMHSVVDIDPARLESVKATYPHLQSYTSMEELIAQAPIDAVAIATPVHTHFELARQAIEQGLHVLIEKPMTHSVETSLRLMELAAEHEVTLMVDHTFIYNPAVQKIRSLVESGELGELYYFDSVRVNLGLFQHDVNVIWDLAPHDISIMNYVLGQLPEAVSAHAAAHVDFSDQPIENIAYLTMFYPNNLISHIHVNWLAPVKVRKTLVGGDRKMVVYDDNEPDEKIRVYDKGVDIKPTDKPEKVYETLINYRTGDMWVPKLSDVEPLFAEVREFLRCIQSGESPLTDGEDGLGVVKVLEAAQRSIQANGQKTSLT